MPPNYTRRYQPVRYPRTVRPIVSQRIPTPQRRKKHLGRYVVVVVLGLLFIGYFQLRGHALADGATIIISGQTGYCLNVRNSAQPGAIVDSSPCNNSSAQTWQVTGTFIIYNATLCLSVQHNATYQGAPISLENCSAAPGQVWLRQQNGYYNPNAQLCLALPHGRTEQQLIITTCNGSSTAQTWSPYIANTATPFTFSCSGDESQRLACAAEKDWEAWHQPGANHTNLLTAYTDGASYEEWCADFASYVYKQAGFPFTNGNTDGWDENIADQVQYAAIFTKHMANSGYQPRPGDIAYFSYTGGHIEVVVSGGAHPTFIYGDSAYTDPTTGNGTMGADTITSNFDGIPGNLVYYLSPKS